MPIGAIFALLAFAGVFLFFVGLSQMRRSAGGSEDFQARLAAYGVTTAGATPLPPATGARDMLNRLFQPAAGRPRQRQEGQAVGGRAVEPRGLEAAHI
jgi:hypothetical protein